MGWLTKYVNFENAVLAYAFCMPINEKLSTSIVFLAILLLIWAFSKGAIIPIWNNYLLVLPVLFLCYVLSISVLSDQFDAKWLELRSSLIAFPLLFLGKRKMSLLAILRVFVLGSVLAYLICFGQAIFNSIDFVGGEWQFEPLINRERGFFQAIVYEGNYFFGKHFSILIQTAYFGFYLTMALAALLIYGKQLFEGKYLIVFVFLLVLGILQTMSLAALGGLFILTMIWATAFVKRAMHKGIVYLLIAGMFAIGAFTQPRLKILMNDLTENKFELNPNGRYGVMLRFLTWDSALEIIYEKPWFGVGVANAQKKLNQKYEEKKYVYPLKDNLNAHNQFLQTALEMGIVGIFLLAAVFGLLFHKKGQVTKKNRLFLSSFMVLLWFNFVFEVFFSRYVGISFFCFFYGLCVTMDQKVEGRV